MVPTLRVHALIDSLTWGGAETLLGDFAVAAPSAGIELTVGYLQERDGSPAATRLREAGVEPQLVGVGRLLSLTSARQVHNHLAAVRPDILHCHLTAADILGGVAARRQRIPSVTTVHLTGKAADASGPREEVVQRLVVAARRHTMRRVIAVSDAVRDAYLAARKDTPARVTTVHNGIARNPPARAAEVRRGLGIEPDAIVAAMVSVLREGKGHAAAIEAVAHARKRFPKLVLLIAGDGPLRGEIAVAAGAMGGGVVLAGHRGDVIDVLGASDLMLHPTAVDAFPTVLLEAGMCGVPVIATRVGGIPEIVDDGVTGLLVPAPATAAALEAPLERTLADTALRARLGAQARARFDERFTAARWTQRLREIYDQVGAPAQSASRHGMQSVAASSSGP
ncbi:MAG TPA: glycosyltransferase family 4 protein [Conexibacter sp.]